MRTLASVVAGIWLAVAAAAIPAAAQDQIDPSGTYVVQGTNPGNTGAYRGTVSVERTGETYKVAWDIAGNLSVGRGVFLGDTLAVAGVLGDRGFVFVMLPNAAGQLEGIWADLEGTTLGAEIWTPQ